MAQMLRVLLLENQPSEAERILTALRQAGFQPVCQKVQTEPDYLDALNTDLDVILIDNNFPQFDPARALMQLRERRLNVPFVVVSGTVSENAFNACMKEGAADYLLKTQLTLLGNVVRYAMTVRLLQATKGRTETTFRQNDNPLLQLTEQALKDSEQHFRALFENSPMGICISRDGIRLYANAALAHQFGYDDPSELVGGSVLDLAAPQSRSQMKRWLRAGSLHLLPSGTESFGLRKDGSVFLRAVTICPIDLAGGRAMVTYTTDLTEQKRLESEAQDARQLRVELENEKELSQQKEQFASMVSHEFRGPLAVILTFAQLVDHYHDRLTPEKRQHHLREIQMQVHSMSMLLDDVLDFSRANSANLELDLKFVDIEAMCRQIIEPMLSAGAGAHRFCVINHAQQRQTLLDEHLLQHILVNLLSNAIKYSPDGGEIRFELFNERDQIVFCVSDQGIGIPPADLGRLFEPFRRAKNAGKIRGTGLGLAIVKSNVEAHGGTITVQSEEGTGTTFTVRLPALAPAVNV